MDLKEQLRIRQKAFELAGMELEIANKKHSMFSCSRVGESVIREELEEAEEALSLVKAYREGMWKKIRKDEEIDVNELERMGNAALELTYECIQVLAMIHKFIISMEGWADEQDSTYRQTD